MISATSFAANHSVVVVTQADFDTSLTTLALPKTTPTEVRKEDIAKATELPRPKEAVVSSKEIAAPKENGPSSAVLPPHGIRLTKLENREVVDGLFAFRHFLVDPLPKGLCSDIKHIGHGYGEWQYCADRPVPKGALVYGVGVGENWDFDIHMANQGAQVFSFDCTQNYKPDLAPGVRFEKTCLGGHTGTELYGKKTVRTLATLCELINRNGHAGRYLHVLKIDCEGCEWRALERFFQGCPGLLASNVGQILMEVHMSKKKGIHDTTEFKRMLRVFAFLKGHGFEAYFRERTWGGEAYRELLPAVRKALKLGKARDFMGFNLNLINTVLRDVPPVI